MYTRVITRIKKKRATYDRVVVAVGVGALHGVLVRAASRRIDRERDDRGTHKQVLWLAALEALDLLWQEAKVGVLLHKVVVLHLVDLLVLLVPGEVVVV